MKGAWGREPLRFSWPAWPRSTPGSGRRGRSNVAVSVPNVGSATSYASKPIHAAELIDVVARTLSSDVEAPKESRVQRGPGSSV
jgi:hypothetical protein